MTVALAYPATQTMASPATARFTLDLARRMRSALPAVVTDAHAQDRGRRDRVVDATMYVFALFAAVALADTWNAHPSWSRVPDLAIGLVAVAALRWRLDCRPRTPARHDLRRDISEWRRTDPYRADRQELLDLRQHRLQAHLARSLLNPSKGRTLVLVDVGIGRVGIVVVDGDERPDPELGVGAQPSRDPRGQRVLTSAQSRADDSIDPPGSRRLDPFAATAREQLVADALGATLDRSRSGGRRAGLKESLCLQGILRCAA